MIAQLAKVIVAALDRKSRDWIMSATRDQLAALWEEMRSIQIRSFRVQLLPKEKRDRGLTECLFDSGAFGAFKSGRKVDLDDYSRFLEQNGDTADAYANLDVIEPNDPEEAAAASFENLKEMRRRGLDPVPVYHIGEDISWLSKMLDLGCTYIGLSASSIRSHIGSDEFYVRAWRELVDRAGRPLVKVHAFGEGRPNMLLRYPWSSADSTNWMRGQRFGVVSYSQLPAELVDNRGQKGIACRGFIESRRCTEIEREVQAKGNRNFSYYFAVGSNSWWMPTFHAVGHRKALFAFPDLTDGMVARIRAFAANPRAVMEEDRHKTRFELMRQCAKQWE